MAGSATRGYAEAADSGAVPARQRRRSLGRSAAANQSRWWATRRREQRGSSDDGGPAPVARRLQRRWPAATTTELAGSVGAAAALAWQRRRRGELRGDASSDRSILDERRDFDELDDVEDSNEVGRPWCWYDSKKYNVEVFESQICRNVRTYERVRDTV
ncbi:hypothetical protein Scep_009777 [Stephania cephalantha]|uniref:Uncharacterized protein n=1 Tax=Stephania cephalantha TaxID=152367 RepID=A0AAP0PGL0_9MAGN